jgi:hypothetical protein
LISNETLVLLTVFSLIHNCMKQDVTLLNKYGVSLDWKDVGYLVFSDKRAQTTCLCVSSPELQGIWEKEKEAAQDRTERVTGIK